MFNFRVPVNKDYNKETYFNSFFNRSSTDFESIDFRVELIKKSSDVIMDFEWFSKIDCITPEARAFLKSTLRFIATGKRDIPVCEWAVILRTESSPNSDAERNYTYDKDKFIEEINAFKIPRSISQLMFAWISKYGGYVDMYESMSILLNETHSTLE